MKGGGLIEEVLHLVGDVLVGRGPVVEHPQPAVIWRHSDMTSPPL